MIMSTLLQPVEKFPCELALKRIDELDQIEIVEQICMTYCVNFHTQTIYASNVFALKKCGYKSPALFLRRGCTTN